MSNQSLIKEKFIDPAVASGDLGTLEKAAAIWKTTIEAEKCELDIADSASKKRSERVRFWIPILVPLISSVALIATLIFQVIQFRENARMMADTAEDTSWREVLNRAKETKGPNAIFSMTLIKGFLDSYRYGNAAWEISISMLGHMGDPDAFGVLFPELMSRTGWKDLNDIIRIGASLNRFYCAIPVNAVGDDRIKKDSLSQNMDVVGNAVVKFLKDNQQSKKNTSTPVDFSGFQFGTKDLSNLDFSGFILGGTAFYRCTVAGAVFSDVGDFEGSDWAETAWWRAKKIDKRLLDYLEREFPYKENVKYPNDTTKSPEEYRAAIDFLRSDKSN